MKILTFNTWQENGPWQKRWEIIFSDLRRLDPDIAAFQEVFNMDFAAEIQNRSGYAHLTTSGRHSGLIFLSKYATITKDCLVLAQSPQEEYRRYVLHALFDVGGRKLHGFNTHLSWKQNDDVTRDQQTEELLAFTLKKKQSGEPAFLCGDFNAAPNKPSVQTVQKAWEDTFMACKPGEIGLTWDYRNPFAARARDRMPERRIDYIFTQGLKARRSEIVLNAPGADGIYPSDHFGVLTEVGF